LVVRRLYFEELLASFVRIKQLSHILLEDDDILCAVKEHYGQVQQIKVHHKISSKYIAAYQPRNLALNEIQREVHEKGRGRLVIVQGDI
jgi:hypothetical protein